MRFTFVTVVVAALAGSALSAPTGSFRATLLRLHGEMMWRGPKANTCTGAAKRSLVNQVGSVVGGLENGLPVGQVEQELQGLLGGSLGSVSCTSRTSSGHPSLEYTNTNRRSRALSAASLSPTSS